MNKEKFKHLPINFLFSLPIFGLTILVTTWLDINYWVW